MKTVYKYELPIEDDIKLELPVGYEILYINSQNDIPFMWCLVDDSINKMETINIRCAGTGHIIEEDIERYMGSVKLREERIILHYFKVK